jgi:ABC-2 type transport system ATP-binding protein
MPETTPLEMDMKVRDFLAFRAGIKGVTPSEIRRKVDEVSGQCEIADVLQRRIGNLSKGYRQRVGLADAMIHDPSILILDEPTAGLDPNQILSVRQLVRRIGEDHTVLLSSHILGEVESTCDHVIIINNGKILADDPIGAVKSRVGQARSLRLVTAAPRLELEKSLSTLPWTESIQTGENGSGRLEAIISLKADIPENELESLAPEVARRVISGGWDLHELTTRERTLEEIFASLTRHHPSPSNC